MPNCLKCRREVRENALFCSNCGASLTQHPNQSTFSSYRRHRRFGNFGRQRRRLRKIIETFRQKGAINPEKAKTIQELGLPPRFEEAQQRRLGQLGIFVEVNGKYYLNEERFKQIKEQRAKVGSEGIADSDRSRAGPST
jgi:hypothetical protein